MRRLAQNQVQQLENINLSASGHLVLNQFIDELANSRTCFSPFGYGELCWRDIEAFQTGAVLIKPDMGHLETKPHLYEPGVTYLPVRWDFADLDDVVQDALSDEPRMEHISQEAWNRAARYIRENDFVNDMIEIFSDN